MAYTKNVSYRVPNTKMSSRYNQWLALIAAIVIGMIISAAVNVLPSGKSTVASKVTIDVQEHTKQ